MALNKTIIKADPREVIVKWVGSGTDTLTLASLVSTGQTLTGTVVPTVDILAVSTSISAAGECTITRNGQDVLKVHDNYEFQTDGIITAVLKENSSHDIAVNLAAAGTLIMRLRKTQGYSLGE
jgi:hypothetical protein